ncbi:MAG: universal stress protein [Desulfamplus sp.]|nr:universal stress protein [Desulfamplus sp.]MBF0259370.1 universal stress protein [Desulfamplus sp.]
MKILVCCTNSEENKRALAVAVKHAKAFNASVDLVSCIFERSQTPMGIQEDTEKRLQEHIETFFRPEGIECKSQAMMTTLTPGEALIQYAEKHNIDQIVLSIKHRSKLGKLFFGSTAQYVILEAPCPVLTVK